MYRTIIVGCDGTEHEADAIALAQQLRDPDGGRLILANASSTFYAGATPELVLDYAQWLVERSDQFLDRAAANVTYGVPFEQRRATGTSAAAALNDLAETTGADLIVLGGSPHGLAADLADHHTARRLVHGAPCAVAVAAPAQSLRFGAPARICVAYDSSPEATFALAAAYDVAVATGASVRLCLALEPFVFAPGFAVGADPGFEEAREHDSYAALDAAAARAPAGVEVELRLLIGPAAQAVITAGLDCDLIVTGSRGFGAVHRVLVGSTSAALLADGRMPLLITPRALAPDAPPPAAVGAGAGAAR